jgi:hypothetical protein
VTEMIEGDPDVRLVYKGSPTLADSPRFAAAAGITLCRCGSTSRRLPRRAWSHGRCACSSGAAACAAAHACKIPLALTYPRGVPVASHLVVFPFPVHRSVSSPRRRPGSHVPWLGSRLPAPIRSSASQVASTPPSLGGITR